MAAQNLANTKQDIIAAVVQKELTEKMSLFPLVTDYSYLAGKGAKSLEIPKLSSFTVQDRTFGAAASENTALSDTTDTIALNKNKIILFGYDSKDAFQSTIEYKQMAIMRAATAHGRAVNDDIISALEASAGLNINAAVPADITNDDILQMRQFLKQNHADMNNVALVIAADQEAAMLKLPEFSRYEYRGNSPAPVVNGVIGSVYGVPVVVNQQVKAQQAFMFEKNGLGFAFQQSPSVDEQKEVSYGTGGMKVAVDQVYGVGGLELGVGVAIDNTTPLGATASGLIAKLID